MHWKNCIIILLLALGPDLFASNPKGLCSFLGSWMFGKSITKELKLQTSKGEVTINRLTPEEFDHLPLGTVVVDTTNGQPFVVGVDFLDLTAREAKNFLKYGTSDAIKTQPFAGNARILSYVRDNDPASEHHTSAIRANYILTFRYKLPGSARNYLEVQNTAAANYGTELKLIQTGDDIAFSTLYFDKTENVVRIVVQMLTEKISAPEKLKFYQDLAATIGAEPPTLEHPSMDLTTQKQMQDFYQAVTENSGGLDALIAEHNQHGNPGLLQALLPEINAFKTANAPGSPITR